VSIEQLDEPPDADPPAEFALCELHWRLIEQPAQQHRIEVAREVHRNTHAFRPGEILDELVASGVRVGRTSQFRELLVQVCHRHSPRSISTYRRQQCIRQQCIVHRNGAGQP
jgi:hypothetical protein